MSKGSRVLGLRDICYLFIARLSDPGFSYVQYSTVLCRLLYHDTAKRGGLSCADVRSQEVRDSGRQRVVCTALFSCSGK